MSEHVVLVGLSGSGKTTLGRLLASRFDRPFYDTDTMIATAAGMSTGALLAQDEEAFRRVEEETVSAACSAPPGVIATGGGVVLRATNRERLRDGNLVLWLSAPVSTLARRLVGDRERPLLGADPAGRLERMARERDALYAASAHDIVEVDDPSLEQNLRLLEDKAHAWVAGRVRNE